MKLRCKRKTRRQRRPYARSATDAQPPSLPRELAIRSFPGGSGSSEGMLETEVEEDGGLAPARADSDGKGQTGDDLEARSEVPSAAEPGTQEERAAALGFTRPGHILLTAPGRLQHGIEGGTGEPDETLAQMDAGDVGFIALRVSGRRHMGHPHIGVGDESRGDL